MTQAWEANTITVTLAAAQGTYAGAPTQRDNVIRLVIPEQTIVSVTLAGEALPQLLDQAAFAAAERGWLDAGQGMILAKSGTLDVSAAKILAFTLKP
jgi:alpha-glucosidase